MSLAKSVWNREASYERSELSARTYLYAVSTATLYGLVLASLIAFVTLGWEPNLWAYLGIGLAIPIVGCVMALTSRNWFVSVLGYTLVVGGLGAISGPTVALYDTGVVVTALLATTGVTLITSIIGVLVPKSLESWGIYLLGGVLALLLVRVGQGIMAAMGVSETIWYMPIIEYAGAVLFSLYIIYDWNRAVRLPHTMDNAVDVALAIFLDVINLFFHLLRIFGGRGASSRH